ncbi:MAG: hypothetical protein U9N59_03140 [Campylobacterota bacterium]|nr:hypothetical protein [Campylobacterota bacterium]
MNKKLLIAVSLMSTVMFSGCATLFGGGGEQNITIKSTKPMKGKLAYSDGKGLQRNFTTPATILVDRRSKDIVITSKNNDFDPVTVESSMNPWVLGDVLATSLISTTTDAVSGAMWEYDETVNLSEK